MLPFYNNAGILELYYKENAMKSVTETFDLHDLHWLDYGDHIGYLYQDISEQALILLRLIVSGIAQGNKIICFLSNYLISLVMENLERNHFYSEPYLSSGQLILKDIDSFFEPTSNFNERIQNIIRQEIRKGEEEGFPCTITAIDGSGLTADRRISNDLSILGEFITDLNNSDHQKTIFFYSQQVAEAKNFWEIYTKHPTIVINGTVYRQIDRWKPLVSLGFNTKTKRDKLGKNISQRTDELAQTTADIKTEIGKCPPISAGLPKSKLGYHDITERIKALKSIKESNESSRALIDAVDDALFLLNPDGTIITANNEGFRRLGNKSETIPGTALYSRLNKKNAKELQNFVERVIQTGKTIKYETKQAKRILENTIYPIFNIQKKVIRLALYSRDISDRVRIEKTQQRHAQEMDALYRTFLEITTHMNLSELLQLIVMRATTLLNETSGTLYLLLPDNETLEAVVSYNHDKDYTGIQLRLGEGLSGKIAQTKQPMFIPNYANWKEKPEVYSSSTARRVLGIPLKLGDQVIGVINVSSATKSTPYTKDEIRLVSLFADQAAIAIENTRLLETIKRDLEERIQISKALEASLAEKEVMLREIHHRVKNNLNVIIALLDLHEDSVKIPNARFLFDDLKSRVRTMALVHENLYQSAKLGQVDFARYLKKLIDYLSATYPTYAPVQIDIDIPAISMDIDNAIPCGLIVNELVTNSLKYAFPAGWQSRAINNFIRIALRQENQQYVLSVSDNGIGFPPGINWQETNTLGLSLVTTLTQQLDGTIEKLTDEGSSFVIRFKQKNSIA